MYDMDLPQFSLPPKPISNIWRPELVRLPKLTLARRLMRVFARELMKLLTNLCLRLEVEGAEYLADKGPLIIAINHLGDADAAVLLSSLPAPPDAIGKIELYDLPVLGRLLDWYGIIWLHRGLPDKRALRAALDGLREGRIILIAPEGRYTLVGGLEEGRGGAAFLAYKAGVPVLPVVMTGTENPHVYGNLRRRRRADVTLRIGKPFKLVNHADRQSAMREGTQQIMKALADLLPPEYRGAYNN